ncbi:MAG: ATP-binding protein [Reichenbachiella sp.]|uniref:AAA family ATPase n=1 Tax=Reichenbachiella sp. TaxID=2184521 RepID=UPI003264284D
MNVIVVFGLPGSGKSYFAERLAKEIGAIYLSSDQIRSELDDRHDYSFSGKMKVYNRMLALTEQWLKIKDTVVLDGTFYARSIREKTQTYLRSIGAHILFLEIKADRKLIKERLQRKRAFSEANYGVFEKIASQAERMCEPHFVIHSNDHNIDDMMRIGLKYINASKSYEPLHPQFSKIVMDEGQNTAKQS